MYKMGLPEVIIWAWEVKGLVMSSCDDLTYVKHPSTELILHVLNRSSVAREVRDVASRRDSLNPRQGLVRFLTIQEALHQDQKGPRRTRPLDHSTSASLVINEPNASPPAQSWTVSDEPVPLQKLQPE